MPLNEAIQGDTTTYLKKSVAKRLDRNGDNFFSKNCAEARNEGSWNGSPTSRGTAQRRVWVRSQARSLQIRILQRGDGGTEPGTFIASRGYMRGGRGEVRS